MADYPLPIAFAEFTDAPVHPAKRDKTSHRAQRSVSSKSRANLVDEVRYGVEELSLETAAGSSTSYTFPASRSRARRDPAHPPIAANASGRVCFVPRDPALAAPRGGAGETVVIKWKLSKPELIDHAVLELFVRGEAQAIWTRKLVWDAGQLVVETEAKPAASDARATEGELRWDGCLDEVPDGMKERCVSVGGSPYKLKLTVFGSDDSGHAVCHPAQAWTYFDVLVHGLELDWEAAEAKQLIPGQRDDIETLQFDRDGVRKTYDWKAKVLELEKTLLDTLHANTPADDHEVVLDSDLVSTLLAQDGANDAAYRAYRKMWGQGPLIPLFARMKLRGSDGRAVDAPWALDGARVIWDWEDRELFEQKHGDWLVNESEQSKSFVEQALDHFVDYEFEQGFAPRSNNCHARRGGKRGQGAAPVFPKVAPRDYHDDTDAAIDQKFPFEVTPCPELPAPLPRRWASVSAPRTRGFLAGRTGVLFQPSRMAGDCYRVSAYLHYDGDAFPFAAAGRDLRRDRPPATRASTGVFEVWRRVHAKILRKHDSVANVDVKTIQDIYAAAGIKLDVSVSMIKGSTWERAFDAALTDRLAALGPRGAPMRPANPAHSVLADQKTGPDAVTFRRRQDIDVPEELRAQWDKYYAPGSFTPKSMADDGATNLVSFIQAKYIDAKYKERSGHSGIFVFLYRWQSSLFPAQMEGSAHSASAWPNRATAYVAYDPGAPSLDVLPNKYGVGNVQLKGHDHVVAHEIGHALFLKHATPESDPNNDVHLPFVPPADPPAYQIDDACLMNYHPASKTYCGLCILRLRGWSCYGPKDVDNTEQLDSLSNTHNPGRFIVDRVEVDVPVSPPKTKRLLEDSDTVYNLPARETKTFDHKTVELGANPPLVLMFGTVVEGGLPGDPQLEALAKPILVRAHVSRTTRSAKVVWHLSRAADDGPLVIAASPRELPTLIDHRDGTATLLTDAVGTFQLRASVNPGGGMSYNLDEQEFVCVNFVIVGAEQRKSEHQFTRKHARVYASHGEIKLATMKDATDAKDKRYAMSVRSRVQLVGGGPNGMRGLDKVRGGWINNMTREGTAATYFDPTDKANTWAGEGHMMHVKADRSLEDLAPALDSRHPMVDGAARVVSMAAWRAQTAVLSERRPHPGSDFTNDRGTKLNKVGCELWFEADDAPEQGWDLEPPTKRGAGLTLASLKIDNGFVAYLCLWTDDAKLLVGVLEEIEWTCTVEGERHGPNDYRLRGKAKVEAGRSVVHPELRAAVHTNIELCPPTTLRCLKARNMPADTDWETGA